MNYKEKRTNHVIYCKYKSFIIAHLSKMLKLSFKVPNQDAIIARGIFTEEVNII